MFGQLLACYSAGRGWDMIELTALARQKFQELQNGNQAFGIQVGFVYGCGGAGFRVIFTEDPEGPARENVAGIPIAMDADSRDRLGDAVIDWEAGPGGGFILRHPDAALVEFC